MLSGGVQALCRRVWRPACSLFVLLKAAKDDDDDDDDDDDSGPQELMGGDSEGPNTCNPSHMGILQPECRPYSKTWTLRENFTFALGGCDILFERRREKTLRDARWQ